MRWKLLRRRLATPRVTVRRHLPWPIRWLSGALVLGFSAAIALWAFETGKDLAGLDRSAIPIRCANIAPMPQTSARRLRSRLTAPRR